MAERQFTSYKADVLSFELREAMLGVVAPGRYRGYDTLTSGGAPSGGSIPVLINHTTSGIRKGTHANPPILSPITGVCITTQGTIIHNTNLDILINILDGSGQAGDRYDLVYLEHEYYDVQGDNPSIIGIKQGTDGGGVPTLDSPAKQVAIIQVKIVNTALTFASLVFTILKPGLIGDYNIDLEVQNLIDNIIGDRQYSSNNYITDSETITASVNKLDIALKSEENSRIAVGNRALDNVQWGTMSDTTQFNVTIGRHGFMPKPPLFITSEPKYFDNACNWMPLLDRASKVAPVITPSVSDYSINPLIWTGSLNLSSKLPGTFKEGFVILNVTITHIANNTGSPLILGLWSTQDNAAKGVTIASSDGSLTQTQQVIVPIHQIKLIYWDLTIIGAATSILIRYLGYIEANIT